MGISALTPPNRRPLLSTRQFYNACLSSSGKGSNSYTPDQFKAYVETIIRKVRSAGPEAEFLLLSNMKFDPGYILDSDKNKAFYMDNMQGYQRVLQQLEAPGIVNLDMNTISGILYRCKKPKDCIANPLHPNDYLVRWYAQGLLALISHGY